MSSWKLLASWASRGISRGGLWGGSRRDWGHQRSLKDSGLLAKACTMPSANPLGSRGFWAVGVASTTSSQLRAQKR